MNTDSLIPDTASRPSLNAVHAVPPEEGVFEERWRQWQLLNAVTRRTDARRARIAFAVMFAAVGTWLGLQLMARPLWP